MSEDLSAKVLAWRAIVDDYKKQVLHLKDEQDVDIILAELREKGCRQDYSMVVLMELKDISLGQAKRFVILSPVWNDTREALLDLQDKVIEVLRMEADNDKSNFRLLERSGVDYV